MWLSIIKRIENVVFQNGKLVKFDNCLLLKVLHEQIFNDRFLQEKSYHFTIVRTIFSKSKE